MLKDTIVDVENTGSGAGITDDGSAPDTEPRSVDVSATIAAIEAMEDTLVEQGVAQAAQAASNSVQTTIDELENASSKAEADAIIDKMEGIDDSQKVLLKSQITKQFEDGGDVTSTEYLTLAYLDMYKKQAIDKDKISEMLSSIDKISLG